MNKKRIYEKYVKRVQDFICAFAAFVLLSPFMLIVAVLVRIKLGSPVIFKQKRPGKDEKIFTMYKFRTMTDERDKNGELLPDEMRLTAFGRFLRRTSCDELPELMNILRGEMSIVGPRPQLIKDMVFMTVEQRRRHMVLPGLTGLAQVNGRNGISWEEKLTYDQKYIERISWIGDWKIILQTIYEVFQQKGVNQEGMDTAEDFGDYLLRTGKVSQEEYKSKQCRASELQDNPKKGSRFRIAMLNCHSDDVYCFRKEILEELAEHGYDVMVSCPYGERLNEISGRGITFDFCEIDRRGKNPVRDLKLLLHYIKVFRTYNPSLILAYTIKPNIYGSISARVLRIPYINNITGLGSGFTNGGMTKKIIEALYHIALKRSSHIFFQNQENAEVAVKNRLFRGSYSVIPGSGVNLQRFRFEDYPDNDNKIVFYYIGRVLKDKNIDDYLKAAQFIKKNYQNTEFNIIGFIEPTEGHYRDILHMLENKGIIKYRGNQKDVRPYMKQAHAIIHPSAYGEGMSNVLLEMAATGRALISTDIAGCREIIEDGVNGYIYQAGNVKALCGCIEAFIGLTHTQKAAMGMASRRKVERAFDRKKVVEAYLHQVKRIENGL